MDEMVGLNYFEILTSPIVLGDPTGANWSAGNQRLRTTRMLGCLSLENGQLSVYESRRQTVGKIERASKAYVKLLYYRYF